MDIVPTSYFCSQRKTKLMKNVTRTILAFLFIPTFVFSQDDDYIQKPTLGVHFALFDFESAANVRNSSLSTAINNKQFGKFKEMHPGLAVTFTKGLTKYFDYSATLAGSFLDYPMRNREAFGGDYFLLAADVSVRAKLFSNRYWVSPYAQFGLGASKYRGYFGAYVPAGVGLQINFFDEAYLIFNSQYRIPITETTNYHFYHSIGIAGNIGKKKE